jgi:hypothetical protein
MRRMADESLADEELARLESMHERVEKLRSRLKDIELDTYSALGSSEEEQNARRESVVGDIK